MLATHGREIESLRETLQSANRELESLRETLQNANRELEHSRATLTANERELSSLRETLASSSRDLDELRAAKQVLEGELAQSEDRAAAATQDIHAAREQMAGLETELKEEREHAESLGELANERREHMTKLQEQVEESEERLAESNWKLGRSLYFERIVERRKGLIAKLLAALRAKMKANVALKAGLDGLRTFKAGAEMNQHKLLQRIDSLKAELKEADETVKRHQGGTAAKEELTVAISRAAALEERLNTQAELIQSLEADLKTAKLSHKAGDEKHQEIERLTKELETKNQVIAKLEADTDEQQRKLAKLRGSESETVRLKALTEKDRGEIDALQREVAQLREALTRQSAATASSANANNADLEAKLKERENSVTRLMGTIKEHEATIKKLTESSESWKRKYPFLATAHPEAPNRAAE
jgi:chromosome segregation ATPase